VTLRVDIEAPGAGHVGVLEVTGSDERLTDEEAARIQRKRVTADSRRTTLSDFASTRFYANSAVGILAFASLAEYMTQSPRLKAYLSDLLLSDEAIVPQFNSPPSAWVPLRTAAEQASAIGLGVTAGGGGGLAMVGAYIGGIFLVKFVTPIVAEAGNATAAGVSAKIRTAFGVQAPEQLPESETSNTSAQSIQEQSTEDAGPST
jgi:hypothetical protein